MCLVDWWLTGTNNQCQLSLKHGTRLRNIRIARVFVEKSRLLAGDISTEKNKHSHPSFQNPRDILHSINHEVFTEGMVLHF